MKRDERAAPGRKDGEADADFDGMSRLWLHLLILLGCVSFWAALVLGLNAWLGLW